MMVKGGCAAFRKTATGQERITDAQYLTLQAPTYQPWTTYPDSPVLTATYPYQVIFSAGAYIRLIVNTAAWYYYFSGDTQLKSASTGKLYQLNGAVWEYISDATNYSYTTLLQANADVYNDATLTSVLFAKTTTDGMVKTPVRIGTGFWRDGSAVPDYQRWVNYPNSPDTEVLTSQYPYQCQVAAGGTGFIVVSAFKMYHESPYTLKTNGEIIKQYYTQTRPGFIMDRTSLSEEYYYISESNYNVLNADNSLYFAKTTTDYFVTANRRINL